MANLYFERSDAPLRTIQEIQFGLLSPEEIKNMSVAHILYPETMDEAKMKPRDQGLNDPRLGTIDRQFRCATCDQSQIECPGHFGHIELAKPVFHPGFLKKIKKLLEIVCHNCGKVLLDRVSRPTWHDIFLVFMYANMIIIRATLSTRLQSLFATPNVDLTLFGGYASRK